MRSRHLPLPTLAETYTLFNAVYIVEDNNTLSTEKNMNGSICCPSRETNQCDSITLHPCKDSTHLQHHTPFIHDDKIDRTHRQQKFCILEVNG